MDDDTKARNRLVAYMAVRAGGLAIFFLGIAMMYTNIVRPGGWPQVGAIIAILGVLDAMFSPRILKRAWDQQDAAAADGSTDPETDQPEQ